mmetsp:Transcript_92729/g.300004  ORF Transcript_92729/g.300004 Transcript_92729/m.300004 type:complete len:297 (-) Transcript_92729:953-1843(-)
MKSTNSWADRSGKDTRVGKRGSKAGSILPILAIPEGVPKTTDSVVPPVPSLAPKAVARARRASRASASASPSRTTMQPRFAAARRVSRSSAGLAAAASSAPSIQMTSSREIAPQALRKRAANRTKVSRPEPALAVTHRARGKFSTDEEGAAPPPPAFFPGPPSCRRNVAKKCRGEAGSSAEPQPMSVATSASTSCNLRSRWSAVSTSRPKSVGVSRKRSLLSKVSPQVLSFFLEMAKSSTSRARCPFFSRISCSSKRWRTMCSKTVTNCDVPTSPSPTPSYPRFSTSTAMSRATSV